MKVSYKTILYLFIVAGLFAPILQKVFNIPQPKLNGEFIAVEKPELTAQGWFDGTWQERFSDYYENELGFRPWLIKIKNQIELVGFQNTNYGIVRGKDDYYFEDLYIQSYLGRDKIPFDSVRQHVEKLAYIQKYLQSKNIKLLTVLAPGKGKFCASYIPDEYHPEQRNINNYTQYRFLFNKLNLPYIDCYDWLYQMKDTASFPIYTKYGTHWSTFSCYYAMDTIYKKMESMAGQKWGDLRMTNVHKQKQALSSDDDLMQIMNVMSVSSGQDYTYGDVEFKQTGTLPKVLIIGDSYVWTLINHTPLTKMVAGGSQYLFYNHEIFNMDGSTTTGAGSKEKTELPANLESYDFIILLNAEPQLKDFSSGFINAYYKELTKGESKD